MAPAAGVMLSAPFIAGFVGPALGLAFGPAGVDRADPGQLGRADGEAHPVGGRVLHLHRQGLNPKLGFLAAWMYFVYDPIVPVLCTTIIGFTSRTP